MLAWNLEYKINKTMQLTIVPKLKKVRSRESKYNKRCFNELAQLVKMLAIKPHYLGSVPQNFQNRECWLLYLVLWPPQIHYVYEHVCAHIHMHTHACIKMRKKYKAYIESYKNIFREK